MNLNQIYENKILIGIATITATIILLGWIAINENARMEEFTERAEGRSIENGARLFEANCATCHGYDGRGIAGRAPALNNPHLFGYDYRGDIPAQITALEISIERATDAEQIAEFETQLAQLRAEETVIMESVLYDWSEMVAPSNNDVCEGLTGDVDPIRGYSDRQLCEQGQLGIELMQFDQRISERLEGAYEDAQLLDLLDGRERDQLAPLFEQRAALLAIEDRTPEQEAELDTVRAQIGEILAFQLPILVGKMETQLLTPLLTERDALEARLDADEELTAEEEERLAALAVEIDEVGALISPLSTVADERATLQSRQSRYNALVDAHEEVKRLREELAAAEGALSELPAAPEEGTPDPQATQRETLTTAAEEAQTALEEAIAARDAAYTALLDSGDILDYSFVFDDDPSAPQHSRLLQVSWPGTLFDFVEGTLVGGRPPSAGYWPQPMAAWSQRSGGPLRDDQIANLVRFILNWDREFTVADLRAVEQFAIVPGVGGGAIEGDIPGNDPALAHLAYTDLLAGGYVPDAQAGAQLFQTLACQGCHIAAGGGTGPSLRGVYDRTVDNVDNRLTDTGYEEQPDLYIIESIVQPQEFIVPGFESLMPPGFGERMTVEEFANLMEYLKEQ